MATAHDIRCGDCLEIMRGMPDRSVDLVFTSPPYEAARTYGIGFNLKGQAWVDWMVERCIEMARICRGVVCVNCEGQTRQFNYSGVPFLLFADLKRAGFAMRKPPAFHRVGIPGSGGPDWLRNDYEPVICFQFKAGKLPWSKNTAMGHLQKWAPGGMMSNRTEDGRRKNANASAACKNRNQWGTSQSTTERKQSGRRNKAGNRPSQVFAGKVENGAKIHTKAEADGTMREQAYLPPTLANPGNMIRCIVGGGVMGSPLAHENEAPFPERLPEFFIRSFCPPAGTVLDPFCGSGTTNAVAMRTGRGSIGIDVRQSQVDLTLRRLATVQPELVMD